MSFSPTGSLEWPEGAEIRNLPDPKLAKGKFTVHRGPLFSKPPSVADVQQGAIGDCYLLAALNAILVRPNGPAVIQEIMKDIGLRVVFRVYERGAPTYVSVNKSYAYRLFGSALHNRGAVWVSILEKAYAAVFRGNVYCDAGGERFGVGRRAGRFETLAGHRRGARYRE